MSVSASLALRFFIFYFSMGMGIELCACKEDTLPTDLSTQLSVLSYLTPFFLRRQPPAVAACGPCGTRESLRLACSPFYITCVAQVAGPTPGAHRGAAAP